MTHKDTDKHEETCLQELERDRWLIWRSFVTFGNLFLELHIDLFVPGYRNIFSDTVKFIDSVLFAQWNSRIDWMTTVNENFSRI